MSISLHCHLYITQGHPHQRPILFYTYPCLSFLSYTLSRLASYTLSRIASYTLSRLFYIVSDPPIRSDRDSGRDNGYGMFCAVFVACFVAFIGRILWPMEKGCFWDGFGSKWRVLERPRSSLACYCMAGLRNCSPRVSNYMGFGAIA